MTPLQAVILGLVEGVTEYLPISSTGHLIITAWLLGLDRPPETKAAVDAFNIILQGGAILAVAGLYRSRVLSMLRGVAGRDVAGRRLLINLFVAFLPAAMVGPFLDGLIERHLFRPVPVIIALFVGGVLLLGIRRWQNRVFAREDGFTTIDQLSWRQALAIGAMQCVAMVPGTSRSMMSIVGGMVVGLRPREAAEFSFLLGLPTLGAACLYKLAKSIDQHGAGFIDQLGGWTPVLLGMVTATISAAIAVKWLVGYLSKHGMALFGWYRIALALFLAWLVWGKGFDVAP
ncbi:MAG TPA: undecaprenyl-diphosphate phosphatase [Phycisphaerales bacterium]|nr:undecaprenyl-diphosphate phosphatase [Phycisphaerales bacterium]HMP35938.1 undecaprenyl-diphosphate phosphatase [Phycisphaerales bacterium]